MHGSNRLGGNSLSDLLVFGKRAGEFAARYVDELGRTPPAVSPADWGAPTEGPRASSREGAGVISRPAPPTNSAGPGRGSARPMGRPPQKPRSRRFSGPRA